jgi:uncharacterized protein (DUF1501 family)
MKDDPRPSSRTTSFSRRALLGGSASLAAASALSRTARAAPSATGKPVLIQVFLRFGMDGLTAVVPYEDDPLYTLRPALAIRPPGTTNGAIDLDGFFGLAPSAEALLTPYHDGRLAIVHAVGSGDTTRSHFEAMDLMEHGDPSVPIGTVTSGWLARYLSETATPTDADLRGIGVGGMPLSLNQAPNALPVRSFFFKFPGRSLTALQRTNAIQEAYSLRPPLIAAPALDTFASFAFGDIDFNGYVPENGAQYPSSEFGTRMRNIATLIKEEVGVEVICVDYGGWDLHADLGPITGPMAFQLRDLSRSLEAFYLDMLGRPDDFVLVGISEFGRHVRENGSGGVDHGHGNAMFVMGNGVNGGQVIADWPGLSAGDLDNGDLATTIDYRDVLAEILHGPMGLTDLSTIFPGHVFTPRGVVT